VSTPIADYGLLADCNGSALVDRAGSIDWLCMPRYDSPAIFARLLDPDAGHWSIRPAAPFGAERRYLPGSLAIETTFTTGSGTVRLIDVMAAADGQRGHDLDSMRRTSCCARSRASRATSIWSWSSPRARNTG